VTDSFSSPFRADDNLGINFGIEIVPATMEQFRQILDDHARYWGERDLRALHLHALVQEFPRTSLVAVAADGIRGYVFGFVTPDHVAYIHLIATREDSRGIGLGRGLYGAFAEAARKQDAVRLKAITSAGNAGSIAFHRSLGFDARVAEDYNGPGQTRVVFTRDLPSPTSG
jgi:GNAT superfamily N-acetyltransferase